MAKWYYLVDGKEVGPVEPAELKRLAGAGRIKPTDKVRPEGMSQWVQATQVRGLFTTALSQSVTTAPTTATATAKSPAKRNDSRPIFTELPISRQAIADPSQRTTYPQTVDGDRSFVLWYRDRFGQLPLVIQIIFWLFYGFLWIPIWWLLSRSGERIEDRPGVAQVRGKPTRVVFYVVAIVLALGLIGTLSSVNDPQSGSTSRKSGSSDQRNADLLIAGIAALGGINAVESVSTNGNSAMITVANGWHISPYQMRLQAAQNLWKLWYKIAPTDNADEARISIIDLNGNEVGGSRFWGGSLIWVQQN